MIALFPGYIRLSTTRYGKGFQQGTAIYSTAGTWFGNMYGMKINSRKIKNTVLIIVSFIVALFLVIIVFTKIKI